MDESEVSAGTGARRGTMVLAAAAVAAMGALSLLPSRDKSLLHTKGRLHDAGHVTAFAVLGLLCALSVRTPAQRVLMVVVAMLLGVGAEWAEHLVYGMPLETQDIVLDAAGVLLGAGVAHWWDGKA